MTTVIVTIVMAMIFFGLLAASAWEANLEHERQAYEIESARLDRLDQARAKTPVNLEYFGL